MATSMLEGGAEIRIIQQLLGHRDLSRTQLDTQVSIKQLKKVHAITHPTAVIDAAAGDEGDSVVNGENAAAAASGEGGTVREVANGEGGKVCEVANGVAAAGEESAGIDNGDVAAGEAATADGDVLDELMGELAAECGNAGVDG